MTHVGYPGHAQLLFRGSYIYTYLMQENKQVHFSAFSKAYLYIHNTFIAQLDYMYFSIE